MYNCSFDKINSNNIFGINTGILHLNYFHNYTVVNHSGYINTAWLRIWNRTGILLKNYTFNTNKTFNVDSLRFNKSIIPQYDTPFRINVTNWYNRNEHSNFSLNNSLQKVRQIIFLDEGEKKETEETIIYANNITLINPNPANSTTFFKTNFICNKTSGLTTSMDIISNKFKPLNETILGIGKQYENRQTNYNINRYLDDRYLAQTFTVGGNSDNETFVLNKIRIRINASAIPFTLYVKLCDNGLIPIHDVMGIYELKKPNSTIISTGIYNTPITYPENEKVWIDIYMTPIVLYRSNMYGIIVNSNDTAGDDEIRWYLDPGITHSYTYGHGWLSYDNGSNWELPLGDDFDFNVSGWQIGKNISYNNVINTSWFTNKTISGKWFNYANKLSVKNETLQIRQYNFTGIDKYYWRVNGSINNSEYYNTSIFNLETNLTIPNSDDYVFISSFSFETTQLFLLILLGIWLSLIIKYVDSKDESKNSILAYSQFGIMIPLCINIAVISLANPFGWVFLLVIAFLSVYILAHYLLDLHEKDNT